MDIKNSKIFGDFKAFLARKGVAQACFSVAKMILGLDKYNNCTFQVDTDLQPYSSNYEENGKRKTKVVISLIEPALEAQYKKYWGPLLRCETMHECYHLKHSNFDFFKEIQDWYAGEMQNAGFSPNIGRNVAGDFLNVLEDGRIEQIAVSDFPAMLSTFIFKNHLIRDSKVIEKQAETPEEEFNDYFGQILSYAKTGYFLKGFENYKGTELETNFYAVAGNINNYIVAPTAEKAFMQCKAMLLTALPYIAKLLKESQQLQDKLEQMISKCDFEGASSNAPTQNQGKGPSIRKPQAIPSSGNSSENSSEKKDAQASKDGENKDEQKEEQGSSNENQGERNPDDQQYDPNMGGGADEDVDFENAKKQLENLSSEFENSVNQEVKKIDHEASLPQKDGLSKKETAEMLKKAYGSETNGRDFEEKWYKAPKETLPQALLSEAKKLKSSLEKILKLQSEEKRFLKSGVIDPRSLYRVSLDQSDIFQRPNPRNLQDSCCYLLIDNSGSMGSEGKTGVQKYIQARTAAAIIEEAFKGFIPTKIALFDTSRKAIHTSLKSFDSKEQQNVCYSSALHLGPGGGNCDSVHINYAATELAKRKEGRKFLIILSDGTPSAYSSKENGLTEVRSAVRAARKKGIKVIPIMFGSEKERENLSKDYSFMYERDIISCSPTEITKKLPTLLKKLILT